MLVKSMKCLELTFKSSSRRNATKRWWQFVPSRGPAAANNRPPSDDLVRGTATVLDAADLRPVLTVTAADGVIRSNR